MTNRPSLDDYVDVGERIQQFIEKYPDGSLQTIGWCLKDVGDKLFIVYQAAAYRTPNDARPGHGTAWEPFPGPTPYTRDSELMNAETAAWGRAIVAVGLAANRKIASRQEVQGRRGPASDSATQEDITAMRNAADGLSVNAIKDTIAGCGLKNVESFGKVPHGNVPAVAKALTEASR